jgi:hypothetical protein
MAAAKVSASQWRRRIGINDCAWLMAIMDVINGGIMKAASAWRLVARRMANLNRRLAAKAGIWRKPPESSARVWPINSAALCGQ